MAEREIAPRIVINEDIHPGKSVIKGTPIPVSLILGNLGAGMSIEVRLKEYEITEEDIRAVWEYARSLMGQEMVLPLSKAS